MRFPFFSDFRYVWTNHVRGRVRGCAKLCEVSVFFFIPLLTCFAPLSPPLCVRVRVHVVFFFLRRTERRATGYPDRQEPMTHSFILSVFGRFVGVWVCIRV